MFLWIWNIRSIGTTEQLVSKLKSLGVQDVCLKYHDGSQPINFKTDFLLYAPVLKQAGFKVGAWGYNYFNYPDAEAALIKEALQMADYYIFDGEIEIEGKRAQAEVVLSIVRQAYPNKILGYAPFPYVSFHANYPYSTFDKYCNFASPQCYSQEMGTTLEKCVDRTLQEFKNAGLKLPVYPSIEAYKMGGYSVLEKYNFQNIGLWDLDLMDNTGVAFTRGYHEANGIPAAESHQPQQPEQKVDPAIVKLQQELNSLINAKLAADGIQGSKTAEAVKKFQQIMGLSPDGIAGSQTWNAIGEIRSYPTIGVSYPQKTFAARWVQSRVGATVDGIFGSGTAAKVKEFQSNINKKYKTNLQVDGIVGRQTWQAMFKY